MVYGRISNRDKNDLVSIWNTVKWTSNDITVAPFPYILHGSRIQLFGNLSKWHISYYDRASTKVNINIVRINTEYGQIDIKQRQNHISSIYTT